MLNIIYEISKKGNLKNTVNIIDLLFKDENNSIKILSIYEQKNNNILYFSITKTAQEEFLISKFRTKHSFLSFLKKNKISFLAKE